METVKAYINVTRGGRDVDVEVHGEVEPLVPGRFSGPPERCYPDEGGYASFERAECACCGAAIELAAEERKAAEDALYQEAERLGEIAYEDAMEARAEARADARSERW